MMMTAASIHHASCISLSSVRVFVDTVVRVEEDPMTQRTVSFRPAAQHTVTRELR
jgi:hypothetical protein